MIIKISTDKITAGRFTFFKEWCVLIAITVCAMSRAMFFSCAKVYLHSFYIFFKQFAVVHQS